MKCLVVLKPSELIGLGGRCNFKLYKKPSIATISYFDTTTKSNDEEEGGKKMLINVNLESCSLPPIQFYVGRSQTVNSVIETALRTLNRSGRSLLGCKPYQFSLLCSTNFGLQGNIIIK